MHRKLTITIDEAVYEGLYRVVCRIRHRSRRLLRRGQRWNVGHDQEAAASCRHERTESHWVSPGEGRMTIIVVRASG